MPLRKYKVLSLSQAKSQDTGEIVHSVQLSIVDTVSIKFKTPSQLLNLELYQALIGQVISLKVNEGEFNGNPWTNFTGDGYPDVQVDARSFLKSQPYQASSFATYDPETGEIIGGVTEDGLIPPKSANDKPALDSTKSTAENLTKAFGSIK